jgi:YVTN family beta-propeller protein
MMLLAIASLMKSGDCANNPETSVAPPGIIFELLALNKDIPTEKVPKYRSPIAIKGSVDGKQLYVAEQTAKRISVIDFTTKTTIKTISLPNEPTGIAVASTGLLYVTCSSEFWPDGMVCEVSVPQGKVLRRLPAGHGACSPVLAHKDPILYVCNRFGDNISVVNITSGLLLDTIHTWREPISADITPDDSVLVVANSLPVQKSTDSLTVASRIILISTQTRKILEAVPLTTGSHSVLGVTVSPDGQFAFATHLIGMFALPATRVDGGWIHTNNCAIVDIKKRRIVNDATLDAPLMGAGNPWGIACSPDGKFLCVAHSGSNELSIIDLKTFITVAETSYYSGGLILDTTGSKKSLSHNLAGILDICDKIAVKSKAPRAITVVGNQVITAGYFGDVVEVFDLSLPGSGSRTYRSATIPLGTAIPMTSERAGECSYFDASLCLQSWQSCHSCHPFTRTDGLNWTLRGPLVTPKNAKSMIYSWWTPPTNWNGSRANAYESIRAGMTNELFLVPDPTVAQTLDTFFMNLKPVPSPYLKKGKLTETAKAGRVVYTTNKSCDCKDCHPSPTYSLPKFKYAYIPDPYDANRDIDIPTCVETWRGAPFNHLGSMDNVDSLLLFKGHSNARDLPVQEYNNMKEFLLSL